MGGSLPTPNSFIDTALDKWVGERRNNSVVLLFISAPSCCTTRPQILVLRRESNDYMGCHCQQDCKVSTSSSLLNKIMGIMQKAHSEPFSIDLGQGPKKQETHVRDTMHAKPWHHNFHNPVAKTVFGFTNVSYIHLFRKGAALPWKGTEIYWVLCIWFPLQNSISRAECLEERELDWLSFMLLIKSIYLLSIIR